VCASVDVDETSPPALERTIMSFSGAQTHKGFS
jgi:hypothetical protein